MAALSTTAGPIHKLVRPALRGLPAGNHRAMQLYHPGRIRTMADELSTTGQQLATRRMALRTAAGQLGWQSSAAGRFEARLAGQLAQLGGLERRLAELAVELRRHAGCAEQRAATIARLGVGGELRRLW